MTYSELLLLALPSLALWGVILWHRERLQGWRVMAIFIASVALYSVLRASAIGAVMGEIDGDRPYLMRHPLLPLGASSPQEIVGWGVAIGLAWALAERVLALAAWRAGAARLTIVSFCAMLTICAAVEGAAIAAGWWRWTLTSDLLGMGWTVPSIALLDWGFVALDLLFPVLVWVSSRWTWRLGLALAVFPLHFLTHTAVTPVIPGVPLTGHQIGHVLLMAAIVTPAIGERGAVRDTILRERLWWLAPALALALALWTMIVASVHQHTLAITSIPLALFALSLILLEARRKPRSAAVTMSPLAGWSLVWSRAAVLVIGSAAALAALWPSAARDQALQREIDSAGDAVSAGDLPGARQALARAQAIDPRHVAVDTLLGLVALREARDADAQGYLDRALQANPNSRAVLQLAVVAALRQKQLPRAYVIASRGRSLFPSDLIFRYLESASGANVSSATMIELAHSNPTVLSELAAVAQLINDRVMLAACREALREQQRLQSTGAVDNP